MIILTLIVNVIFVFLAMWFIATMGDSDRLKNGNQDITLLRLTDDGGSGEQSNEEQGAIETRLYKH